MWFLKETYLNDLVPFNTTVSLNLALSVFYGIAEIREAMVLLENDLFLSKLTLMFDKSRSKGHVRWERAALTFIFIFIFSPQHLYEAVWWKNKADSQDTPGEEERGG